MGGGVLGYEKERQIVNRGWVFLAMPHSLQDLSSNPDPGSESAES